MFQVLYSGVREVGGKGSYVPTTDSSTTSGKYLSDFILCNLLSMSSSSMNRKGSEAVWSRSDKKSPMQSSGGGHFTDMPTTPRLQSDPVI